MLAYIRPPRAARSSRRRLARAVGEMLEHSDLDEQIFVDDEDRRFDVDGIARALQRTASMKYFGLNRSDPRRNPIIQIATFKLAHYRIYKNERASPTSWAVSKKARNAANIVTSNGALLAPFKDNLNTSP